MFSFKLRDVASSVGRWLEGGRRSQPLPALVANELLLDQLAPLPAPPRANGGNVTELAATNRVDRRLLATVFDSSHPVRSRGDLFGRDQELDQLLAASLDFRQHSVVYGARGSGKTSLVRVFGDYADQNGVVVIYMACEPGVGFADLLRPYLRSIPAAALGIGMKDRFRQDLAALPEQFGPRAFVELVAESVTAPLVLIFDEFDRITDPAVKADVAAAMKLLSDALSSVLFMLVGIARNISDVVESHPSLRRHMRVVSLGRIEPTSVDALIDHGVAVAGMEFEPKARSLIARAACGSPFHVRLFCHHASLAALRRRNPKVAAQDATAGLGTALELWAGMNAEDAAIFVELTNDPTKTPELERIARAAAVSDQLPPNDEIAQSLAIGLLGRALHPTAPGDPTLTFRDSTAPQFLIALIILMEATLATKPARGQEPQDALRH